MTMMTMLQTAMMFLMLLFHISFHFIAHEKGCSAALTWKTMSMAVVEKVMIMIMNMTVMAVIVMMIRRLRVRRKKKKQEEERGRVNLLMIKTGFRGVRGVTETTPRFLSETHFPSNVKVDVNILVLRCFFSHI